MLDQENIIYLKIWVLSYILLDDLWVFLHVNHLREFKGQSTLCNVLSTHMQQTD